MYNNYNTVGADDAVIYLGHSANILDFYGSFNNAGWSHVGLDSNAELIFTVSYEAAV